MGIDSHDFQSVDLFATAHDCNLRGHVCSGFCCHHGSCDDWGKLPNPGKSHKHAHHVLSPHGLEGIKAQQCQVCAHKNGDHAEDRKGLKANFVGFRHDLSGWGAPSKRRPEEVSAE